MFSFLQKKITLDKSMDQITKPIIRGFRLSQNSIHGSPVAETDRLTCGIGHQSFCHVTGNLVRFGQQQFLVLSQIGKFLSVGQCIARLHAGAERVLITVRKVVSQQ